MLAVMWRVGPVLPLAIKAVYSRLADWLGCTVVANARNSSELLEELLWVFVNLDLCGADYRGGRERFTFPHSLYRAKFLLCFYLSHRER
jgi:hypothetical protein